MEIIGELNASGAGMPSQPKGWVSCPKIDEYTFHILGENAWWFESFLKEGRQITLCATETYVLDAGTEEEPVRIPSENNIRVEKANCTKAKAV